MINHHHTYTKSVHFLVSRSIIVKTVSLKKTYQRVLRLANLQLVWESVTSPLSYLRVKADDSHSSV